MPASRWPMVAAAGAAPANAAYGCNRTLSRAACRRPPPPLTSFPRHPCASFSPRLCPQSLLSFPHVGTSRRIRRGGAAPATLESVVFAPGEVSAADHRAGLSNARAVPTLPRVSDLRAAGLPAACGEDPNAMNKCNIKVPGARASANTRGSSVISVHNLQRRCIPKQIGSSPGFEDGEFESAKFLHPASSFHHAAEYCLFIVDSENHAVRKADLGRTLETVYPVFNKSNGIWNWITDKLGLRKEVAPTIHDFDADSMALPWHLIQISEDN